MFPDPPATDKSVHRNSLLPVSFDLATDICMKYSVWGPHAPTALLVPPN